MIAHHQGFLGQQCLRRTCEQAFVQAVTALTHPAKDRRAQDHHIALASKAWESASLLRDTDLRIPAGLLLTKALLAGGRFQGAICQTRRVMSLARRRSGGSYAQCAALLLAAQAWEHLGNTDAQTHLIQLAHSVFESQHDEDVRRRMAALFAAESSQDPALTIHAAPALDSVSPSSRQAQTVLPKTLTDGAELPPILPSPTSYPAH